MTETGDGLGHRQNAIERALKALRAGELVVLPTDTVYGVAALPAAPGAIEAIFRAKGRSDSKALPVLGADLAALGGVAEFDARAMRLADRFWPGALTLVLPRADGFHFDLGGTDPATVAVRIPNSTVTRALLAESGPLAVTSANVSGEAPATSVDSARAELADAVSVYLDEGPCTGAPSTVVSLLGKPEILRVGGVASADIRAVLLGDGLDHQPNPLLGDGLDHQPNL